jgi:hypothetical protein
MRGFAVLWMVCLQILEFFSMDFQMYAHSLFRLFDFVNWLPTFMFVSGLSVWLLVEKRLSFGWSKWRIMFHGLKRYISYIFLSLALCLWCFSLQIFLELNEILIAIGVYALITLCLLLIFFGREWFLVPLSFLVYGLSSWFRSLLGFQVYPFYLILPFFFLGSFSAKLIIKRDFRGSILFEFLLLAIIATLAFAGDNFSYAEDSLGFVIFNVFLTVLLFLIVSKFQEIRILNIFSFAGRNALFFYVFHYAVWYKLAVSLGISHSLDWTISIIWTFFSVAAIFPFAHLMPRLTQYFKRIVSKPISP